jgi:hypothetical protein
MIIIRPFFLEHTFGKIVLDAILVLIFLSCVNAIKEKRGIRYITLSLFVIVSAIKVLTHLNRNLAENVVLLTIMHSLTIVFLVIIVILVLSYVLKSGKVTRDRIAAAICVYLLLGTIWAQAYILMEMIQPGSFASSSAPSSTETYSDALRFDSFYFSFVTLTTLGYGDITPKHPVARAFTVLEAIIGPLYLAILIARLVGLHISQQDKKEE